MSRSQYSSWLYVWDDGDNPGAGSKVADSTGLNGNWVKISDAFKAEHNTPGGAHADAVIGKNNLKTSAADGSTIELDASVGLRIKDAGVTKAKLATAVADASTIELHATNGLQVKDAGVTGAKLKQTGTGAVVDETTLEFASNEMQIKDAGVTFAKVAEAARRKFVFTLTFAYNYSGNTYSANGKTITGTYGYVMPFDGEILSFSVCKTDGGTASASIPDVYDSEDISAGAVIGVGETVGGGYHIVLANGSEFAGGYGNTRITKDATKDALLMITICSR